MLCATLLLPVPGGPARQRMVAGWSAAVGRRASGHPARLGRVGAHAAHGQILEDPVLDVLEPVVGAIQVARHPRHVDLGGSELAPRKVEHRVEEPTDDRDLGAHGGGLAQLAELTRDELARGRRELLGSQTLRVAGEVLVGLRAGLLDLVAQHAHLLVQQHLALRALDALLHLEGDLLLHAEHRVLLGEALEQGGEALLRALDLQQRLLLPGLDLQVRGDDVGQLVRTVRLLHHELRLVGELRVQLHVAHELVGHAAREAARTRRARVRGLERRVLDQEVGLGLERALGADALVTLDQRLDAPVGQLEQLQHASAHADRAKVLEIRVLRRALALRAEDQRGLRVPSRLDGGDGLLAADEDRRDHLGEEDEFASRQEGQGRAAAALPLLRSRGLLRLILRHAPAPICPPR